MPYANSISHFWQSVTLFWAIPPVMQFLFRVLCLVANMDLTLVASPTILSHVSTMLMEPERWACFYNFSPTPPTYKDIFAPTALQRRRHHPQVPSVLREQRLHHQVWCGQDFRSGAPWRDARTGAHHEGTHDQRTNRDGLLRIRGLRQLQVSFIESQLTRGHGKLRLSW